MQDIKNNIEFKYIFKKTNYTYCIKKVTSLILYFIRIYVKQREKNKTKRENK